MPEHDSSKPIALHFGAGKIGRGFLGQLYFESGFETVFVDVDARVVDLINESAAYPLELTGRFAGTIQIENVRALVASDHANIAETIRRAAIVSTAVGVRALEQLSGVIAEGVHARISFEGFTPLNIIVCENDRFAAGSLRDRVLAAVAETDRQRVKDTIGFVPASVGRMVADVPDSVRITNPLLVRAESYAELPVDADCVRGELPRVRGLKAVRPFEAELDKKLFIHNGAHAALAYLGYRRGHEFIADALADSRVETVASKAMDEVRGALIARWNVDAGPLIEDLWVRFANRALGDTVERVAIDPLRKLRPDDRLIGAARCCVDQGNEPRHVCIAAAAAVLYDHPSDTAAAELVRLRREKGIDGVLAEVCGICPDDPIAVLIHAGITILETIS